MVPQNIKVLVILSQHDSRPVCIFSSAYLDKSYYGEKHVFFEIIFFYSNLKGGEEEVGEKLGETQADGAFSGLVCDKDEDHLMDSQQWNQGQS